MKLNHYLFLLLILAWSPLYTQQPFDPAVLQQARIDVVYLASDYLAGREAGTPGEQLAAEYIAHRMEQLGLQPKGDDNSWYQPFAFTYRSHPHAADGEARTGKNVIGWLDNGADRTIVIGAHYDHLGEGKFGSLHKGDPAIHNGADDNASGIAALLRIATELRKGRAAHSNYLFIAFSGEEMGLYGSKYFVEHPTIKLTEVAYMLNMDMVGRLNGEKTLAVYGVGTSPTFQPALDALSIAGIRLKTTESGIGPSDHTSFYLKDLPVLHFFTGQHREYHKPSDDVEHINFIGLLEVSDLILALIDQLDSAPKPAFTKTKEESSDRQAARFKVSLGVMPDYVHDGKGMRVDAVLEDRPAAKAGLQDGDIIIGIGEKEVTDIYSYMEGLSQFKAGDKTRVRVQRGTEELEFEVQF